MTLEQLNEWEAYYRLDPTSDLKDDYRIAYLAMLIVNSVRAVHCKKGTKMTDIEDHLIKWGEEKTEKKQTADEMKKVLMAIAATNKKK